MSLKIENSGNEGSQPGTLYAWDSESNIAYVNEKGKTCILAASAMRGTSLGAEASFVTDNTEPSSGKLEKKDEILKLSSKDSLATAIDVTLFHYCMLMINNTPDNSTKEANSNQAIGKTLIDIINSLTHELRNSHNPSSNESRSDSRANQN